MVDTVGYRFQNLTQAYSTSLEGQGFMQTAQRPPQPSLSAVAQTGRFMKAPFALLQECRKECGDVFSLRLLGLGDWIFLCSPRLAEEMFKAPEDHLSAGDANRQFLGYLLGMDSAIAKDGPEHRERRSLLSTFLNGQEAASHTALSRQITTECIARWPLGEEFSLLPHTTQITLRLLIAVITGIREPATLDVLVARADEFFETALKSPLMMMPWFRWNLGKHSPWGRILWLRNQFRAALEEEIEARRQQNPEGANNILTALLAARDSQGEPLANATILDEITNLVSAGQETSSRILVWAVRGILAHPEALARIHEELETVLQGRPIDSADLPNLKYLDAVINEGIRYQPLGPFTGARRTKKPFVIGGFEMPVGSLVAHCHAEISQREDLFPMPRGFHPENFHNRSFSPYEWCPFGGGARTCLGRGLALMHLKAVLATIFQQTAIRLCQTDIKPVSGGFLLIPEKGLMIELERRL